MVPMQGDSIQDFIPENEKTPVTESPNTTAIVTQETQLPATAPAVVLDAAKEAAKALQDVIANKKKKVVFNGEQYLEFEDWQTLGKFYSITAKVMEVKFVEYGEVKGFEAVAVALDTKTGMEISRAEAMCLNDEGNWKSKPLFQLKSMAQTRASSKVLRNVLAWVAVLAGYKPTPAEEMDGIIKPAVVAPTTTETKRCEFHDATMTQRFSQKKNKYYFAHEVEGGKLCFGF